jgi:uncharacterized membrane protein YeaQ/YmgE (transglycosylase-associated protein family)
MDMTTLTPIIIQLVIGAIGGNAAGAVLKDQSLGTAGNTVAGAVGGLGGGWIAALIPAIAAAAGGNGMDLQHIAGGGIGGIVLTIIAGFIKNSMGNKA